jgi:hypothetical protein
VQRLAMRPKAERDAALAALTGAVSPSATR